MTLLIIIVIIYNDYISNTALEIYLKSIKKTFISKCSLCIGAKNDQHL